MKLLCLGSALWCCVATAQTSCPAELRMAYNNNWLPYVQVTEETVTGDDIELVRAVVRRSGIPLHLVRLSEQRALQQLEEGKLDLVFAASYTKERSVYAYFSNPYREEYVTAVLSTSLLAQHPNLNSSTDFYQLAAKHWSGAVNLAGYYGEVFEAFKQRNGQNRLFHVAEESRRLQMVAQGRAQYSIVDQAVAHYHINHHQELAQLSLLPFTLHKSRIHLMLSKKTINKTCLAELNLHLTQHLKSQTASGQ